MLSNFSLLFSFLKKNSKKYHYHPLSHLNMGTPFSRRKKYCVILMTTSWNMLKQHIYMTHSSRILFDWLFTCLPMETHTKQLYHHTICRMYNINCSYPFNDGIFMSVRGGCITSLFFDTEAIAF
jgi:hypothetical protein